MEDKSQLSNQPSTLSLTGKTILVTGGTGGIGEVTARELARQGAEVIIVGRNLERTQAALQRIRTTLQSPPIAGEKDQQAIVEDPGQVDYLLADLSDLSQVRHLAGEYQQRYDRLDVLINNAGGYFSNRHTTVDGYELTFALNHLSYFLLTQELLPILEARANGASARVVNVSSNAHHGATLDFDDLQLEHGFNGWRAYSSSKLANILFTTELARRLAGKPVTANVLHPGFVATNFAKNNGLLYRLAMPIAHLFALSPEQGARTSVYLAASAEVSQVSGVYFEKERPARTSEAARDTETARRLWEISAEMVDKN